MSALLLAVFLTSVAGSLHCVGMCGIFATIAAGGEGSGPWRVLSYNLARLAVYGLFGVLAGSLGGLLDAGAGFAGFQRASMILFALFLIGAGVISLTEPFRRRSFLPRAPGSLDRAFRFLQQRAAALPPARRAAAIGAVNALMPCGWLWAFVACAGGTASALGGGLVMIAFWLGGLPAMALAGATMRRAVSALPRAPGLLAVAWILAGVILLRMPPIPLAPSSYREVSMVGLETSITSMSPSDRCCGAGERR